MSFGEEHGAFGDDAINVENAAGDELLEQIFGLLIAKLVEPGPQLFDGLDFLHANAGSLGARLEQPRPRNALHEFAQVVVIQDRAEFGNADARFAGLHAHSQLVAKIAHRGEPYSREPQMFAERRDIFHVEFVQGHDAVDVAGARGVGHRMNHVPKGEFRRHEKHFVNRFAGPAGVAELSPP